MKDMRFWFGVLMFIGGIALGLYVGLWYMFIGGIIGLVEASLLVFNQGVVDSWLIGLSIVKILFSGLVGYISAFALILPSFIMMGK